MFFSLVFLMLLKQGTLAAHQLSVIVKCEVPYVDVTHTTRASRLLILLIIFRFRA